MVSLEFSMITSRIFPVCFVLVLAVTSCTTLQVATDYNPGFDFGNLKTYAWLTHESSSGSDVRINNALVNDRVVAAVDAQLSGKGYHMAETAPDFYVTWLGAIDRKIRVDTINDFYGPYWYGSYPCCWPYSGRTYISEYDEGTLIIDVLSAADHKLVWRGSGKDYLRESGSPEETTRRINEAVSAILSEFPPGTPVSR